MLAVDDVLYVANLGDSRVRVPPPAQFSSFRDNRACFEMKMPCHAFPHYISCSLISMQLVDCSVLFVLLHADVIFTLLLVLEMHCAIFLLFVFCSGCPLSFRVWGGQRSEEVCDPGTQ